ncbi:MAG: MarR family transcriptional regulator [Dehalococcoidia bacterium]|nr:MarR family transcriptional regulator [Dehalococcoidia bacterium]
MSKTREDLIQSLIEQIRCVIRGMHRGRSFAFGEFKLSGPQIGILFFVSKRKDGAPVKDLATFFGITPGAVTQFIDGLVEKDLVRREGDSNDRRILRIRPTEFAERKLEQFKKDYFATMSLSFTSLDDAEVEELIRLLAKINIPPGTKEPSRC